MRAGWRPNRTISFSTPPPTGETSSGRPGRTGRTWSMRTTSTTRTPWRKSSPSPPALACGSTIPSPTGTQFQEMVLTLAQRQGLTVPAEVLLAEANKWELRHGGVSGPHGPAVYHYMAGQSAFGSKGMSRQPGPKSDGSGCLFCFPAFCLARERKVCYHFTAKMTRVQRGDAGWNGC